MEALAARGARAMLAPAIALTPAPPSVLDRVLAGLAGGEFAWAIFTSRSGVDALFDRLAAGGGDPAEVRALVAAVGDGTAASLLARGVTPDLVPRTFTTASLGAAMPDGAGRVLLARADIAPEGLEEALRGKGWTPVRVDAYRTRLSRSLPVRVEGALREGRVDAVTFTSASTVTGFVQAAGAALHQPVRAPKVVCIGPVTADAARQAGFRVDAAARPHTIEGLVAAVERVLAPRRARPAKE
jgi:uroporphyrinogen-III synthase